MEPTIVENVCYFYWTSLSIYRSIDSHRYIQKTTVQMVTKHDLSIVEMKKSPNLSY